MCQEQLGRLRSPKGECLASWSAPERLPLGLWAGAPADTGEERLVPGVQCHVPSPRGASQPCSSCPRLYSCSYSWPHSKFTPREWGLASLAQEVPGASWALMDSLCFPFPLPCWTLPSAEPSCLPECPALSAGPGGGPSDSLPWAALLLRGEGPPRGSPLCLYPPPLTGLEGIFL